MATNNGNTAAANENARQKMDDERARIARDCLRQGMPPYQAARKCLYPRVALMQEEINRMETREKQKQVAAANGAEICADSGFLLEYLPPKSLSESGKYKLHSEKENSWCEFEEVRLNDLLQMLLKLCGAERADAERESEKDALIEDLKQKLDSEKEQSGKDRAYALELESEIIQLKAELYDLSKAVQA